MADRTPDESTVPIDAVIVTIAHPHGDIDAPLSLWMELGPGPRHSGRASGGPTALTGF